MSSIQALGLIRRIDNRDGENLMPLEIFKAYYCGHDSNSCETAKTMLVYAHGAEHAARIVKAYDDTAIAIRLEYMPKV